MTQPVAYWPNLKRHNEAWEQAKIMLGPNADPIKIMRKAQEILSEPHPSEEDLEIEKLR